MPKDDASVTPEDAPKKNPFAPMGRGFSPPVGKKFTLPVDLQSQLANTQQMLQVSGMEEIQKLLGRTGALRVQEIFREAAAPALKRSQEMVQAMLRTSLHFDSAYSEMLSQLKYLDLVRPAVPIAPSPNTAYSEDFRSADDYFSPHEIVIDSFDELHRVIQGLIRRHPSLQFLWRGQQNASWGLHSSLYRRLMDKQDVRSATRKHRATEPYPSEDDMVSAEETILKMARVDWRFDDLSALETFARLQHFGAPTRLIDVSRNPFIGAWFAVESSSQWDDSDGRLFAAATFPVLPPEKRQEAEILTRVRGELARPYLPFWHVADSSEASAEIEWGTGTIRRFWVPPLYEQRILAQNGCFLLDGVPVGVQQNAGYFKRKGKGNGTWKKADLLASGSIFTKLYDPSRTVQMNKQRAFPPTFTFRITAAAKRDIRQVLEERFSYSASTMYPDIEGLASHLRSRLDELI